MKKIHIGLLPRIIIAIILGIAIGNFLPTPLVRLFVTFNSIFGEFLNFSIPLIILGLVTIAIADIGKGAGRMLLVTALIAYGATLFSGFLSYFTGAAIFPSLITPGAAIIVMPSMKMKPANREKSKGMPCIIIKAKAQATIFRVLPDK